ncbi:Transcription factor, MADS-box [Corchorus olitorius]|uniref:Transcription factor, MADS-box n=1 Tax=Corchorus olitorius TaxID=93759 RepID=A0A1R3KCA0_9ROSI|nr:Transcription factor, MADS-box [Corchorus olitorius]
MVKRMEGKLIEDEKARKNVYETRKKNLLKKAKELSILCDSKILVLIFDQDKQKHQIWPDNDEEAKQIINRFKQKQVRVDSKRASRSAARNQKERLGEKFPISDHKRVINFLSENQLQNLCHELDAKIADVKNVIKSKQGVTEEPSKGKGKEIVVHQEPVPIQQDQSFHQMLYHKPNFEESSMNMMQNGIVSYPSQFSGSYSSSNIPFMPLAIHSDHPADILKNYHDPDTYYPHTQQFGGSSTISNIPFVPLTAQFDDLTRLQPADMNATNFLKRHQDPNINYVPAPPTTHLLFQ